MRYFWKKATEEYNPGAYKPGCVQHTLQSFKNTILSRINVDQNILKNALFFGKSWKNRRSVVSSEASGG